MHEVASAANREKNHDPRNRCDEYKQGSAQVEATVEGIVTEEIAVWLVVERIVILLVVVGIVEHGSFQRIERFVVHMSEGIGIVFDCLVHVLKAVHRHELVGLHDYSLYIVVADPVCLAVELHFVVAVSVVIVVVFIVVVIVVLDLVIIVVLDVVLAACR